jgi:hypothetical protein
MKITEREAFFFLNFLLPPKSDEGAFSIVHSQKNDEGGAFVILFY